MSTNTTGSGQFYCFLHFKCKPGRQHEITNELQRLSWLVKITQMVRACGGDLREWLGSEDSADKEIRVNQSSHLIRRRHESLVAWLARLEETLRIACAEPEQAQQPLEV
jgi:hypothetical protein